MGILVFMGRLTKFPLYWFQNAYVSLFSFLREQNHSGCDKCSLYYRKYNLFPFTPKGVVFLCLEGRGLAVGWWEGFPLPGKKFQSRRTGQLHEILYFPTNQTSSTLSINDDHFPRKRHGTHCKFIPFLK